MDPNEVNKISMANSRPSIEKPIKDGFVIWKPTKIHTRSHARRMKETKRMEHHHYDYIKRKGMTKARLPTKIPRMRRMRVLSLLLCKYRVYIKVMHSKKKKTCDDSSHAVSTLNLGDKV